MSLKGIPAAAIDRFLFLFIVVVGTLTYVLGVSALFVFGAPVLAVALVALAAGVIVGFIVNR